MINISLLFVCMISTTLMFIFFSYPLDCRSQFLGSLAEKLPPEMVASLDNVRGLTLAMSSSAFIGSSFVIKKVGLKKAGDNGVRAGCASSNSFSLSGNHNSYSLRMNHQQCILLLRMMNHQQCILLFRMNPQQRLLILHGVLPLPKYRDFRVLFQSILTLTRFMEKNNNNYNVK